MNKLVVKVTVALSTIVVALVFGEENSQYSEMENWLWEYTVQGMTEQQKQYNDAKETFYLFMDQVRDQVAREFPVDPALQQQVDALKAEYEKARADKLKAMGFESEIEFATYVKYELNGDVSQYSDDMQALEDMYNNLSASISALMKDHNEEFQRRFEAAFVEAVRKFKENGEAMK